MEEEGDYDVLQTLFYFLSPFIILEMELQFDVSEENKKQEEAVLAPLDPNIKIRTMKSDIQSLKESGGDLTNIATIEDTPSVASRPAPSDRPIFVGDQDVEKNNSPIVKIIIVIIAVLALAAGIGFASYYLASRVL